MAEPATSSELLLRRLEWTVIRRLDGLLQGDYRTLFRGAGVDLLQEQHVGVLLADHLRDALGLVAAIDATDALVDVVREHAQLHVASLYWATTSVSSSLRGVPERCAATLA